MGPPKDPTSWWMELDEAEAEPVPPPRAADVPDDDEPRPPAPLALLPRWRRVLEPAEETDEARKIGCGEDGAEGCGDDRAVK